MFVVALSLPSTSTSLTLKSYIFFAVSPLITSNTRSLPSYIILHDVVYALLILPLSCIYNLYETISLYAIKGGVHCTFIWVAEDSTKEIPLGAFAIGIVRHDIDVDRTEVPASFTETMA